MKKEKEKNKAKADIFIILLIVAAIVIASYIFSKIDMMHVRDFILSFGMLAPLAYMIIMAAAIVISPIPSIPLDIMAGGIWGGFLGGTYSVIGASIGAIIAFYIARILGRPVVEKYLKRGIRVCDKCYGNSLFWFILFTRLLPIFQFDIISYASGLTNIKMWKFALATVIGMIPVTFFLSYSGHYFTLGNVYVNVFFSLVLIGGMYIVPRYIRRFVG